MTPAATIAFPPIRGAFFADAGQAWLNDEPMGPVWAGVGIRATMPLGPVSLGVAWGTRFTLGPDEPRPCLDRQAALDGAPVVEAGQYRVDVEPVAIGAAAQRAVEALERVAAQHLPADYHRPAAVAGRLHRILAHRPRLALPVEAVPLVTEVLADRQAEIDGHAAALVSELADRLAA